MYGYKPHIFLLCFLLVLSLLSGCSKPPKDDTSNNLPSVEAGDPQSANEQTKVSLTGSASDTDGSVVAYQWVQESGTEVVLSSTDTATVTFTVPNISSDETATFKLTVTDDDSGQSSDTVEITFIDLQYTGVFLDGAVQGVKYRTSSGLEGMTNAKGEYQFNSGDSVSFYVGQTALGEVKASALSTVFDLESPAKVSQLLQSIDTDGIESNGIQISEEIFNKLTETVIKIEEINIEDEAFNKKFEQATGRRILVSEQEAQDAALESLIQELLHRFDRDLLGYLNETITFNDQLAQIAGANNADDTLISYRQRLLYYLYIKYSRQSLNDDIQMHDGLNDSVLSEALLIEQRTAQIVKSYQQTLTLATTIQSDIDDVIDLKRIGKLNDDEFADALTKFSLDKVSSLTEETVKKIAINQMRLAFGDAVADLANECNDIFKVKLNKDGNNLFDKLTNTSNCSAQFAVQTGTLASNTYAAIKADGYGTQKYAIAIARSYLDIKYINRTFQDGHDLAGQYFGKNPTDQLIQYVANEMCTSKLNYCSEQKLGDYKPEVVKKYINESIDNTNFIHKSFLDLSGNYQRGHLGLSNNIEKGYLTIEPSLKKMGAQKPQFCLQLNNITSFTLQDMEITTKFIGSSAAQTSTVTKNVLYQLPRAKEEECFEQDSSLENLLNQVLAVEYSVSYQPEHNQAQRKTQTGQVGYDLIRDQIDQSLPTVTAIITGQRSYTEGTDTVVRLNASQSFASETDDSQFQYLWTITDQQGNSLDLTITEQDQTLTFSMPSLPETKDKLVVYVRLVVSSKTTELVSAPVETKVIIHRATNMNAPNNLAVVAAGNGQVALKWDTVSDAQSYRVYYATSSQALGKNPEQVSTSTLGKTITNLTNGSKYYFKVAAVNAKGQESIRSNEVNAMPTPPPNAPTGLTAIVGDRQIKLSWSKVDDAKGYRVYYATSESELDNARAQSAGSTNKIFTDLENGTTYHFTVIAFNANGQESNRSSVVMSTPMPTPTTSIKSVGDRRVTLSWIGVSEATKYHVYHATSSIGLDSATPQETTSKNITIDNLTNGMPYYFRVTAVNNNNQESEASNMVDATPTSPPSAPTNLDVEAKGDGWVTLKWGTVGDATVYRVYYATSSTGLDSATPQETTSKNITINNLTNGTPYYFRVTAVNTNNQESEASNMVDAMPTAPPSAPTGLTATVGKNTSGQSQVTLKWNVVTNAETYNICYANKSIDDYANCLAYDGILLLDIQGIKKSITNLTDGTEYFFKVAAVNANNQESEASNQASATPLRLMLNDTGINWGINTSGRVHQDCKKNLNSLFYEQDCSYGRDVQAREGNLEKVGGGDDGFDFTKLNAQGSPILDQTKSWSHQGTEDESTKWSCVRDNHTGLIWEVKTDDGGIHDKDNVYKWGGLTALGRNYDSTEKGTYHDEWDILVNGSNDNNAPLCGFNDWRVPTFKELMSVTHKGKGAGDRPIDTDYFPNTLSSRYWSSSPYSYSNERARVVHFKNSKPGNGGNMDNKDGYHASRTEKYAVRLVRGEKYWIPSEDQ